VSYDSVIADAQAAGWQPGFTLAGTLLGSVYAFLNTIGYTFNAYYVGEMKQAQRLRAQVIAMFGSLLVFGLLTASLYWLVYYRIGPDFFQGLSYLYATGSSSYALPFSYLNAANLIAFGARLPGLYLLANVLVMLSYLVSIITWPFIVVRSLFAWSFDRILPAKIAQVDSKGNPWVAVLVATAVSEAYVALVVANPSIGAWLAYQIFGWALAWVVVGLAALDTTFPPCRIVEKDHQIYHISSSPTEGID